MEKSRDYFFDNAKFYLILAVTIGHGMEVIGGEYISIIYRLIYIFHMPAFAFITGYFTKYQKKQNFSILIMQYFVFQTLYQLFSILVLKTEGPLTYTTPYWILWFSLAVILWKVIVPYFSRLKYPIALSILLALLAGYDISIGYFLSLSRVIVLFPFFLLGYYAKSTHLQTLKQYLKPAYGILLFVVSCFILSYFPTFPMEILYNSSSYQAMELTWWYAWALRLLFLSWGLVLGASFFALIPSSKKFYSHLGQRTLQAYLLHGFIMRLLTLYNVSSYITSPLQKILFFAGVCLLTILLLLKPMEYPFIFLSTVAKKIFPGKANSTP